MVGVMEEGECEAAAVHRNGRQTRNGKMVERNDRKTRDKQHRWRDLNAGEHNRAVQRLPLATQTLQQRRTRARTYNDNFNNKLDVLSTASPLNRSPHCPSVRPSASAAQTSLHAAAALFYARAHAPTIYRDSGAQQQASRVVVPVDTTNKISCASVIARHVSRTPLIVR